ncbi:MAG: APC family permease [Armatimonadetes bacterium]|nr:APC family permease [Armatimonadota bacterium]MBS1711160.1 APC family permease [Armatimonadota bacterium]MBX3108834.1 APC family permease [Fimbriimonadaceae bacterium]
MSKKPLKHILFGKPIHREHAHHERLSVPFGLAVFASDALSSVAYATEEVLLVLILAGSILAYNILPWIAVALAVLLVIIAFSYYQTINSYPESGGTYIVSSDNLGPGAGQVAAAAILIDYVLTVAVSVSSGVQAVVSLAPHIQPYATGIAVAAVGVLCIMNLRGAKESGVIFAIPTYGFVFLILCLVAVSIKDVIAGVPPTPPKLPPWDGNPHHEFGLFLIARAFAASCTALTGTEALADGVKAFKAPEQRNASRALMLMVGLLVLMFLGISVAAWHNGIVPAESSSTDYRTVVAQIAFMKFGNSPMTFAIMGMTAGILFLAANTAFADFPRLCSFVARDGYLPRQLMSVGDRMVYQNGILVLTAAAMFLIVIFKADTHSLIPLYALGVFIAFTLSQAGMFQFFRKRRWLIRTRGKLAAGDPDGSHAPKDRNRAIRKTYIQGSISGFGTLVTFFVGCILFYTKLEEKIWIVVIAMAILVTIFQLINRYYKRLASQLTVDDTDKIEDVTSTTLLLVPRLHKGVIQAIEYARASSPDCRALHVSINEKSAAKIKQDWVDFNIEMPLIILDSPYRSISEPIIDYVDQLLAMDSKRMVTVIVPEAVASHWWQGLLHNNAAIPLKLLLGRRRNVVITNIRYYLEP